MLAVHISTLRPRIHIFHTRIQYKRQTCYTRDINHNHVQNIHYIHHLPACPPARPPACSRHRRPGPPLALHACERKYEHTSEQPCIHSCMQCIHTVTHITCCSRMLYACRHVCPQVSMRACINACMHECLLYDCMLALYANANEWYVSMYKRMHIRFAPYIHHNSCIRHRKLPLKP